MMFKNKITSKMYALSPCSKGISLIQNHAKPTLLIRNHTKSPSETLKTQKTVMKVPVPYLCFTKSVFEKVSFAPDRDRKNQYFPSETRIFVLAVRPKSHFRKTTKKCFQAGLLTNKNGQNQKISLFPQNMDFFIILIDSPRLGKYLFFEKP